MWRSIALLSLLLACSSTPAAVPAPEPVAIAIVYQASFSWIGEELTLSYDRVLERGMWFPVGVYLPLRIGIDALLADLPPGSNVTLVAYANGATKIAAGRSETITSAVLGDQRKYNEIGSNLVAGLETALEALSPSQHPRKVLVVIGEGRHDYSAAFGEMLALRARMNNDGIVAHAFLVDPNHFDMFPVVKVAMPAERVEVPWSLVPQLRAHYASELRQR